MSEFFFFKQKTAYEMRISDWSSDVCSSDLLVCGITLATTPNVAKRFGAGRHGEIGPLVRQALWMGGGIGVLSASLMWNAEPVLHLMRVEPALVEPTMDYLRAVACGFPAVALYQVLRCFSDGLGHPRPSMEIGRAHV